MIQGSIGGSRNGMNSVLRGTHPLHQAMVAAGETRHDQGPAHAAGGKARRRVEHHQREDRTGQRPFAPRSAAGRQWPPAAPPDDQAAQASPGTGTISVPMGTGRPSWSRPDGANRPAGQSPASITHRAAAKWPRRLWRPRPGEPRHARYINADAAGHEPVRAGPAAPRTRSCPRARSAAGRRPCARGPSGVRFSQDVVEDDAGGQHKVPRCPAEAR